MRETTFKTIGMLPETRGRWNVRVGGGHIVFVSEDPETPPYMLHEGKVKVVVDWSTNQEVQLVMPKEDA